jgi:hypothetical protein
LTDQLKLYLFGDDADFLAQFSLSREVRSDENVIDKVTEDLILLLVDSFGYTVGDLACPLLLIMILFFDIRDVDNFLFNIGQDLFPDVVSPHLRHVFQNENLSTENLGKVLKVVIRHLLTLSRHFLEDKS